MTTNRTGPSLARTSKKGKKLPDRIVLYTPPGWGKTSFGAYFPEAMYLMTPGEDRLIKLIQNGLIPPTGYFEDIAQTWNDVLLAVNELIVQQHDYLTFVVDTGNGAAQLAEKQVCAEHFNNDWGRNGFNEFGAGEKITASEVWQPFLGLLDRLRERRGMRIVLLCHDNTKNKNNATGLNYDKVQPDFNKTVWSATHKWADMILYGSLDINVKKESKLARGKATGGQARILHTDANAAYDAKNCHQLPSAIRLGSDHRKAFEVFKGAFPRRPPAEGQPAEESPPSATASAETPPESAAPRSREPTSARELLPWLARLEAQLLKAGLCGATDLLTHVKGAACLAGWSEKLCDLDTDQVNAAVAWALDFARQRKAEAARGAGAIESPALATQPDAVVANGAAH